MHELVKLLPTWRHLLLPLCLRLLLLRPSRKTRKNLTTLTTALTTDLSMNLLLRRHPFQPTLSAVQFRLESRLCSLCWQPRSFCCNLFQAARLLPHCYLLYFNAIKIALFCGSQWNIEEVFRITITQQEFIEEVFRSTITQQEFVATKMQMCEFE